MDVNSYAYHHPTRWDAKFEPACLPDMLAATTARNPEAPFLHFLGRTYTYSDIFANAQRFAAGLIEMGIAKGDRVGTTERRGNRESLKFTTSYVLEETLKKKIEKIEKIYWKNIIFVLKTDTRKSYVYYRVKL